MEFKCLEGVLVCGFMFMAVWVTLVGHVTAVSHFI